MSVLCHRFGWALWTGGSVESGKTIVIEVFPRLSWICLSASLPVKADSVPSLDGSAS